MDDTQPIAYFLSAVSQVGFPIVLTGYLLLRFEKKLEVLTDNILRLTEVVNMTKNEEINGK